MKTWTKRILLALALVIPLPAIAADIDLTPITTPIIECLGIVMGAVLPAITSWAVYRWGQKLSTENRAALSAAVGKAASNMAKLAVTQTLTSVKLHGWDHVETQSAQIAIGVQAMINKVPDLLTKVGIDPATSAGQLRIADIVRRELPAAITEVAASPGTPVIPDDQKTAPTTTVLVSTAPVPVITPEDLAAAAGGKVSTVDGAPA